MTNRIDSIIVAGYFLLVFIIGILVSRRYKGGTADEFITGGKTLNWYHTAFTVIAMAVDPGIIGLAGLGFLWGMYPVQWNGVHVWVVAWFAAMFFIPIYWRSKIYTTPELLEKRFNVQCRTFFSIVMVSILVVTLAFGVYLGALMLQTFLGWSFWMSVTLIFGVAGLYVIMGGMRTVLAIDFYQAIYLLITMFVVCVTVLYNVGGISGFASVTLLSDAGTRLPSTIPPNDWNLFSTKFYPLPALVLWSPLVGLSWLACNYGLVQRLLAAKSEKDAQKALLMVGGFAGFFVTLCCYLAGVGMRVLDPNILPDEAYPHAIITMFPVGIKGLLVGGIMAALLSTIDGMMTASSALVTEDIYIRFFRPKATGRERKIFIRIVQVVILVITLSIIPFVMKSKSAMTFLQNFYGDVLGVVVAIYLVGMFSKRATPRAAFISMITGVILSVSLDNFTAINFAYVGVISFTYAITATLLLSQFEQPLSDERLANLTIHTLSDVKGPWVGLKSWPDLWKWALGMAIFWFTATALWEWYVWTR